MSRQAGWMLIGLVVGWAGSVEGQAIEVNGGSQSAAWFRSASHGEVLRAEVTHSFDSHSIAVLGISQPRPGYGSGGYFLGGLQGVQGVAGGDPGGPGGRIGVLGLGAGGSASNFGVHGTARGGVGSGAYGVYGLANCVGVGTCSKYAVYADGDLVWTGSHFHVSDLRFKESLAPLEEALGKLLALEVVSYEHVRSEEAARLNLPEGPRVGFIAQQVAEVLPELVGEVVHPAIGDPRDKSQEAEPIRYQALKPIDLIPYLVRALQEQQAKIEALQAQLLPLQHRLAQEDSSEALRAGAK